MSSERSIFMFRTVYQTSNRVNSVMPSKVEDESVGQAEGLDGAVDLVREVEEGQRVSLGDL
jgi:hypothetical protein